MFTFLFEWTAVKELGSLSATPMYVRNRMFLGGWGGVRVGEVNIRKKGEG